MRNHIVRSPETDRYILKVPERMSEMPGQPVLSVARTSDFDTRFDPSDYSPGVPRTFLAGTVDRLYVSGSAGSFSNGTYTVKQTGMYFVNLRCVFYSTVTGAWAMFMGVGSVTGTPPPVGYPQQLSDTFVDGRTGQFAIPYTLSGLLYLPAGNTVQAGINPIAVTGTGGVYVKVTAQLDIFQVGP